MKRHYLALLLVGALLGGLMAAGCTPATAPTTEPTSPSTPTTSTTPTTPSQPAAKAIKWDVQSVWPAGFQTFNAMDGHIDRMNVATGGRLEISWLPSGSIVPAYEIFDGIERGAVTGGISTISAQFGKFATAMFFDKYPAGPNTYESYVWLYEAGGLELWRELYEMNNLNVHVVGFMGASQAENFGWFNEPITSLDDFQGLKFRTQGTWGDVLTSLGASVVTLPGAEVYESAQRGVIDAFEYATPAVDLSAGFPEIRKVMMEPGIHAPTALYDLTLNGDAWKELPDDLKVIVELGCEAACTRVLASTDYADVLAYQEILDMGVEVHRLPDEVIQEIVVISNEFWDKMAADDPFFAKVLKSQRDFLKEFRAMQDLKQPDPALLSWPK